MSVVLLWASSAAAATFRVTNANDSGPGSFREAILSANQTVARDVIIVPGPWGVVQRIVLQTPLPPIRNELLIVADRKLHLDGSALSTVIPAPPPSGLIVEANRSVVFSVRISGFPGDGIVVRNASECFVGQNRIEDNGGAGIRVDSGSGHWIGGQRLQPCAITCPPMPDETNVVVQNRGGGILVRSSSTRVSGNDVGRFWNHFSPLNGGYGILVQGDSGNSIIDNIVSHEASPAICVAEGSAKIQGNTISSSTQALLDVGCDGPTPNTSDPVSAGLQHVNAPVLESAAGNDHIYNVAGLLHGIAEREYEIDIYTGDPVCGRSTVPYQVARVRTDLSGFARIDAAGLDGGWARVPPEPGVSVLATATDVETGVTSELSACVTFRRMTELASLELRAVAPATAVSGTDLVVTTEETNHGPGDLGPHSLDIDAPVGAIVLTSELIAGRGRCWNVRDCGIDLLRVGETARMRHRIRITARPGETASYRASVWAEGQLSVNPTERAVSIAVTGGDPRQNVDLEVKLRGEGGPADRLVWVGATITNRGQTSAVDVLLKMTLEGTTFYRPVGDFGTYGCRFVEGAPDRCIIRFLLPGESLTVGMPIENAAVFTANATVTSEETDQNPANNQASLTYRPAPAPPPAPPATPVPIPRPLLFVMALVLAAAAVVRLR